ncbi:unnamed protein product [Ilex paraguariensis]|uniref:Uncharacterized protein n=1 Tax=Ilex paraguariensis TaxID=185542 RepID=A0ABC8R7C6_9AQUA
MLFVRHCCSKVNKIPGFKLLLTVRCHFLLAFDLLTSSVHEESTAFSVSIDLVVLQWDSSCTSALSLVMPLVVHLFMFAVFSMQNRPRGQLKIVEKVNSPIEVIVNGKYKLL